MSSGFVNRDPRWLLALSFGCQERSGSFDVETRSGSLEMLKQFTGHSVEATRLAVFDLKSAD
jgi:hypothetical protein